MRHVIKYLLVLAVLMSGFYMARMFRVPQAADVDMDDTAENGAARLSIEGEDTGTSAAIDPLPVAALTDADKTALAVPDDLIPLGNRGSAARAGTDTARRSLGGQPAVRGHAEGNHQRSQADSEPPKGDGYDNDSERTEIANRWNSRSDRNRIDTDSDRSRDRRGSETERERDDARDEPAEPRDSSERVRRTPSYDNPLPDFAANYQPWLDPLEEPPQAETVPAGPRDEVNSHNAPSSATDDAKDRYERRHQIVEGDTLRRLAERYLGDRERYLDLYQANETVLLDPRLLPIGVEIVIPGEPDALASVDEDNRRDRSAEENTPWEE